MMLTIEIQLYATLRSYMPANASSYQIETGSSIKKIIETLNLPSDQVKLIFANGVQCDTSAIVQDGDHIGIFPPIGGG